MVRKVDAWEAPDGSWTIKDIPCFADHKAVFADSDGQEVIEVDLAMMQRMHALAEARRKLDGFVPPLHVNHTGDANAHGASYYAGRYRLRPPRKFRFEGRQRDVLFCDFTQVPAEVFADIEAGKLSYLSPQADLEDGEMNSIAVMDHVCPHFKFGAIVIGKKHYSEDRKRRANRSVYRAETASQEGGRVQVHYARVARPYSEEDPMQPEDETPMEPPAEPGPVDIPDNDEDDDALFMDDVIDDEDDDALFSDDEDEDYCDDDAPDMPAGDKKVDGNYSALQRQVQVLSEQNAKLAARLDAKERKAQYSRCVRRALTDLVPLGYDAKVVRKRATHYLKEGGVKAFTAYYRTAKEAALGGQYTDPNLPPEAFDDLEPPSGDPEIPSTYPQKARERGAIYAAEYRQLQGGGMRMHDSLDQYVDRQLRKDGLITDEHVTKARSK